MRRFNSLLGCAVFLAACARVPDGAEFHQDGFILTDEKLELPLVDFSAPVNKWCFSNLRFTGSEAQVLLEISAQAPFDPRTPGGAASLEIRDSSGNVVFQVGGQLREPCCDRSVGQGNRWESTYYGTSYGPKEDTKTAFFAMPALKANIGHYGEYCVTLKFGEMPRDL